MIMNFKKIVLLFSVIIVAIFLRFYQLSEIPSGLNIDEASMGYNAYSLSVTGKDRYGEAYPILFRSFGSFQAPIYTYLTVIPINFFDASVFSVRFVSAISGLIIVLVTFLFVFFGTAKGFQLAILSAFFVAIAPWAVLFTRVGTEAAPGLALFSAGVFLCTLSLKRSLFLIPGMIMLGLSTHAYYSERLTSLFFLAGFIYLFRKTILSLSYRKVLILSLLFFFITLLPHLMILNTGAITRRLNQVNYWNDQSFSQNSGSLKKYPFGKTIYVTREFMSQYFAYLSPKNLFVDPDPQEERSLPDLSVFYSWMFIPWVVGLYSLFRKRSQPLAKIILLIAFIGPLPAALTTDPFYTIRTLVFLWTSTIVIAFGFSELLARLSRNIFRYSLVVVILLISAFSIYSSYFVLLNKERGVFDYAYTKVLDKTKEFSDKKFIVDSSRQLGAGIRYAFYKKYDPTLLQQKLVIDNYYSNFEIEETYDLGNIEARAIEWKNDIYEDQVLVGDNLAISESQIKEHKLSQIFTISDRSGKVVLWGYLTHPKDKCLSEKEGHLNKKCAKWL